MHPLVTRRALNRATLARQHLLRRTGDSVIDVVEHLVPARDCLAMRAREWQPVGDPAEVAAEGRRLLAFLAPGDEHAIEVSDRPSRS
ncbi:hypothetical protein AB0K12_18045 [Nonomuraea sp. NPDC049419]|uniref:hypothetical protein n=1 Tax=Nonomuraea sp. NPDC049419 TaxID=3155772 RepID=UPI00342CE609